MTRLTLAILAALTATPALAQTYTREDARAEIRAMLRLTVRALVWDQRQRGGTYQILPTHSGVPADGTPAVADRVDTAPHDHAGRTLRDLFSRARQGGAITDAQALAIRDAFDSGMKYRLRVDDYHAPNGTQWFVLRFGLALDGRRWVLTVDSRDLDPDNPDLPGAVDFQEWQPERESVE